MPLYWFSKSATWSRRWLGTLNGSPGSRNDLLARNLNVNNCRTYKTTVRFPVDDAAYKESSSKSSWSHSSRLVTLLVPEKIAVPWTRRQEEPMHFGSRCFFFRLRLFIGEFWNENKFKTLKFQWHLLNAPFNIIKGLSHKVPKVLLCLKSILTFCEISVKFNVNLRLYEVSVSRY